ncbi:MAG: cytochrome c oxidase subunit 3 [Gammaproteobacteria bacterium]|jgi:cytochrome c oxidase subunit 3|nr:cytochrome c oxidase subunit 3 [Gammaproteobacteria bacterium]
MSDSNHHYEHYYVPAQSHWPITGSIGLGCFMVGLANWIHGNAAGHYFFFLGSLIIAYMMFGWFRDVIRESHQGLYSKQMDRSFRWGMAWFIFSEVMFFAAFFGALFYARHLAVPWLGGEGERGSSHLLWPNFQAVWPLLNNPDPQLFSDPKEVISPWGIPLLNTALLLSSGGTITVAHWGLVKNKRALLIIGLFLTIALGITFLGFQAYEYYHAYHELNLKMSSGIYGSTFFMLTGFHGAHVTIGTIMLIAILGRCLKGHFTPEHHFGFEAVAWYWHFVDVVWLFLFVFVYCL